MKLISTSNITDEQIKKCPNCGAEVNINSAQCPYCDFLLADEKQIAELDKKINYLEEIFIKTKNLIPEKFIDFFIPPWLFFSVFFLLFSILLQISDVYVYSFNIINIVMIATAGIILKKGFRFYFLFIKTKNFFKKETEFFLRTYPKNLTVKNLIKNFEKVTVLDSITKKRINFSIFVNVGIFSIIVLLSLHFTANITTSALGKNVIVNPKKVVILKSSKTQTDFKINDVIIENRKLNFVFGEVKERYYDILPTYEVRTFLKIKFKNPQQFAGKYIHIDLTLYKNGEQFFSYIFSLSGAILKENFTPNKIQETKINYFFEEKNINEMNSLYIQMLRNTDNLKAKYLIYLTNEVNG